MTDLHVVDLSLRNINCIKEVYLSSHMPLPARK